MDTREIRRVGADEVMETAFALQSYAFGNTPLSKEDLERERERATRPTNAIRLVAFDGGKAAAVVIGIPMTQNVRGRQVPMLGISGVASHPGARRRGHVRALLDQVHREFRDEGSAVAALWPFRATFYERFGYAGFPKQRSIRLYPDGLQEIAGLDLPGEVTLHRIDESAAEAAAILQGQLAWRHGFACFEADRTRDYFESANQWLACARSGDDILGAVTYTTTGFGNELSGDAMLTADPLGRMLLLRWFAAHTDQYSSFTFQLPPDERPDLWYTDVKYADETKVAGPTHSAPMGRVLDIEGLAGTSVGRGTVVVEIVDDPLLEGVWTLDGTSGALEVSKGGTPTGTLTAHGLSALVYGVLHPAEIRLRGFGRFDASTAGTLAIIFPPASPYLFSQF